MSDQKLTGYVLTAWDSETGLPSWPVAYGVGNPSAHTDSFSFRPMPGNSAETVDPWLEHLDLHRSTPIEETLAALVDQSPTHGYLNVEVQGETPREALEGLLDDILNSFMHTRR